MKPEGSSSLWVEQAVGTRRLPDEVRAAAVRAGLIVSVTLVQVVIAVLGALAEAWIAAPATLAAVVSTVVSTWAVLDVWVTRQVWVQRHGVVSTPSSVARERRSERRQERQSGPTGAHRRTWAGRSGFQPAAHGGLHLSVLGGIGREAP